MPRKHPAFKFFGFALSLVVLDQAIKYVVKTNMHLGEEIIVLGDWCKILFVENPGAAFGMTMQSILPSLTEQTAKLILTVLSLGLVAFIGWYLYKVSAHKTKLPWLIGMVLGGAVGNIIDRVFYGVIFQDINTYEGGLLLGRVVDMCYVDPFLGSFLGFTYSMPVWNFADACITVGIILMLIFQRSLFQEEGKSIPGNQPGAPIAAAEVAELPPPSANK